MKIAGLTEEDLYTRLLSRHLNGFLEKFTFPADVIVTVDVDAYQLV